MNSSNDNHAGRNNVDNNDLGVMREQRAPITINTRTPAPVDPDRNKRIGEDDED